MPRPTPQLTSPWRRRATRAALIAGCTLLAGLAAPARPGQAQGTATPEQSPAPPKGTVPLPEGPLRSPHDLLVRMAIIRYNRTLTTKATLDDFKYRLNDIKMGTLSLQISVMIQEGAKINSHEDIFSPQNQALSKLPRTEFQDVWKNEIIYTKKEVMLFELRSPGPDKKINTQDDMAEVYEVLLE